MAELKLPSVKISESELLTRYGFSSRGTGTECLKRLGWEGKEPFLTRDWSAPPGPHCLPGFPNPWRQDSFCFVFQILRNCWTSVILHRVFKNRIVWVLRGCRMNDMGETFKAKFFEDGRPTRSLPVEVEGLGVPRLHLGQLVADDLHQHGRELHLQGLGLTEGVEAEFQQVAHQLQDTEQVYDLKLALPTWTLDPSGSLSVVSRSCPHPYPPSHHFSWLWWLWLCLSCRRKIGLGKVQSGWDHGIPFIWVSLLMLVGWRKGWTGSSQGSFSCWGSWLEGAEAMVQGQLPAPPPPSAEGFDPEQAWDFSHHFIPQPTKRHFV